MVRVERPVDGRWARMADPVSAVSPAPQSMKTRRSWLARHLGHGQRHLRVGHVQDQGPRLAALEPPRSRSPRPVRGSSCMVGADHLDVETRAGGAELLRGQPGARHRALAGDAADTARTGPSARPRAPLAGRRRGRAAPEGQRRLSEGGGVSWAQQCWVGGGQGKVFFSEQKKQKIFGAAVARLTCTTRPRRANLRHATGRKPAPRDRAQKFSGGFFRKRTAFLLP